MKTLPNYTFGFETKSLMIECNARGYPQPVIYWAKSTNSDVCLILHINMLICFNLNIAFLF